MSEPHPAVRQGEIVAGKYRVDRVLGVGGMGTVVAATHLQLEQRVALKLLHPELAAREDVVERFLREARAAVKIQSEHVARVADVTTLRNGAPLMVMEFLEGEDLEHVLTRRGALPIAEAVGYILQACEAIAEAHALGIVHRDLKPANLFLAQRTSGAPIVKVLDFGISKAPLSEREKALTQEATLMGTPAYMSPEQMRASKDIDARADVWALGVCLHELVTQELPFPGDTIPIMIAAVLTTPHRPLSVAGASLLQRILDRCFEKEPARRFPDVAALAEALVPLGPPGAQQSYERIATVLGSGTRVTGAGRTMGLSNTLAVPTPPGGSAGTLAPMSSSPGRMSRNLLIVPGVLLGLGAMVAASLLFARKPSPTPSTTDELPSASATTAASQPAPVPAPSVVHTASVAPPASASAAPNEAAETTAPSARPSAWPRTHGAASAPAKPGCKVVSFYDDEGNKRFRQDCSR